LLCGLILHCHDRTTKACIAYLVIQCAAHPLRSKQVRKRRISTQNVPQGRSGGCNLPGTIMIWQDLLPCALALTLLHSLPPVLSVPKLDTYVIWRYRMIKSQYIFRNLSIFRSLLQILGTVSEVLSADNYAAMASTQ
jgi:hypothetical protein